MSINSNKEKPIDPDNQSLKEYRQLLDEASYRHIEPVNGFERILLQSHEPNFLEAINKERDRLEREYNARNEGQVTGSN